MRSLNKSKVLTTIKSINRTLKKNFKSMGTKFIQFSKSAIFLLCNRRVTGRKVSSGTTQV